MGSPTRSNRSQVLEPKHGSDHIQRTIHRPGPRSITVTLPVTPSGFGQRKNFPGNEGTGDLALPDLGSSPVCSAVYSTSTSNPSGVRGPALGKVDRNEQTLEG